MNTMFHIYELLSSWPLFKLIPEDGFIPEFRKHVVSDPQSRHLWCQYARDKSTNDF